MSLRAPSALRFETSGNCGMPDSPGPADARIRKVLHAIQSNPGYSILELAALVNLSSSRLSHLFKATTGLSLQKVLTTCRLEIAVDLLHSTRMPIKEISYRIGYLHAPSFVRAFRNKFGASPSHCRTGQSDPLRK